MVSWRSHISLIDLQNSLISRSNIGLPRIKKYAQCNSSLDPRSNVMVMVARVSSEFFIGGGSISIPFHVVISK